ncbi:unnamed protein product [Microthlaspi erraticum]|uniref:Uncharacterized protein n=1 Tax=Microthlaspi erraticum TaxID=1685480 RepID=A0A6D2HPG9_9BRAS|nr:unnamed protein product [Microthlaspi erraticum]
MKKATRILGMTTAQRRSPHRRCPRHETGRKNQSDLNLSTTHVRTETSAPHRRRSRHTLPPHQSPHHKDEGPRLHGSSNLNRKETLHRAKQREDREEKKEKGKGPFPAVARSASRRKRRIKEEEEGAALKREKREF